MCEVSSFEFPVQRSKIFASSQSIRLLQNRMLNPPVDSEPPITQTSELETRTSELFSHRSLEAANNLRSRGSHFFHGSFAIARLHRAHRVFQSLHCKAFLESIKHGVLDAVVRSQAPNPNFVNAQPAQLQTEVGSVKGRVTIFVAKPLRDGANVNVVNQIRMKLGAFGVLHTVYGPRAAKIGKMFGACRVPIASPEYGLAALQKFSNQLV